MRRTVAVVLLGLALGLASNVVSGGRPVCAQETDEEAKRELAKQLFLQANEEARQGRYRGALPLYERAIKLAPEVAALHRNIGVVYKKLGRCKDAIVHFDRYLELRPDAPDAEATATERDQCRAQLEEHPEAAGTAEDGTLTIVANIDGAVVTVDGVVMGQTPVEPLNLKPGTYNILITKPGYEPWQRRFPVAAGRDVVVTVTLALEKKEVTGGAEERNLVWKWTTIGVGGAMIVTGIGLTIAAELDRAEFEDADRVDGVIQMDQSHAKALEDNVNTYRLASYVMYGVGAAAATGGVLWLLLDKPQKTGEGTVTPVSAGPIPGGGIVTFTGSF